LILPTSIPHPACGPADVEVVREAGRRRGGSWRRRLPRSL
jgi:hypothetical protein